MMTTSINNLNLDREPVNRILVPFDSLYDEDTGILNLIREKYSNEEVFYMDKIKTPDDVLNLVLNSDYTNPLELVLKKPYMNKKDIFYKEFLLKDYESILHYAKRTLIPNFIALNPYDKITIATFNDIQTEIVEKLFNNSIPSIRVNTFSDIDLDDFDIVILKRFSNVLYMKNIVGKMLYVANYRYNLENNRDSMELIPRIDISIVICETCLVYLMSIFEERNSNDASK